MAHNGRSARSLDLNLWNLEHNGVFTTGSGLESNVRDNRAEPITDAGWRDIGEFLSPGNTSFFSSPLRPSSSSLVHSSKGGDIQTS